MYKNYNKVKTMSIKNENKCNSITNYKSNNMVSNKYKNMTNYIKNKHFTTGVITLGSVLAISILVPEIALASKFDIDAGVKAATDPIIKGINDHWGKAVVITGTAGAVVGEGDARQRATRAAFAATAAGGVVLALLAMLT